MQNLFQMMLLLSLQHIDSTGGKMSTEGGKVLLLPFALKSHVSENLAMGETLAERGHSVAIVLPESYPGNEGIKRDSPVHLITYRVAKPDLYSIPPMDMEEYVASIAKLTTIETFRSDLIAGFEGLCSNPLSDDELYHHLEKENFDLAVVDAFSCTRCLFVIPYRLGIPYVSLTTMLEPWLVRLPALPSFVPTALANFFTDRMSFWDRLSNTYQLVDWSISTRIPFLDDAFIKQFVPDNKPYVSLDDLARKSKLWLMDTDDLINFATPRMPNMIDIGGLTTQPPKPLPEDLRKFVDDSNPGFVVVSFGSRDLLSATKLELFLKAIKPHTQYRFVLRTKDKRVGSLYIPPHVKTMPWVPQNDILGHPKCLLFVTHCGANSQFEALYHGVPMLGFPVYGDQPYNARRMVRHGYGRYMDITNFTVDELSTQMTELLTNDSYRDNIARASRIFRSRPMNPRERAAFWIEQVLEGNVDHLYSPALDMPWYEYLMLDIIAFVVLVPSVLLLFLCHLFCRCTMKRRQKKVTKAD